MTIIEVKNANTIFKNNEEIGSLIFPFLFFKTAKINLSDSNSNIIIKATGLFSGNYSLIENKIEKFSISKSFFKFYIDDLSNNKKYQLEKVNLFSSKYTLFDDNKNALLHISSKNFFQKLKFNIIVEDQNLEIDDLIYFIVLFLKIRIVANNATD